MDISTDWQPLAAEWGISSDTLSSLESEGFISSKALSVMEKEDVEQLSISRGQKTLLRAFSKELRNSQDR